MGHSSDHIPPHYKLPRASQRKDGGKGVQCRCHLCCPVSCDSPLGIQQEWPCTHTEARGAPVSCTRAQGEASCGLWLGWEEWDSCEVSPRALTLGSPLSKAGLG